MTVQEDEGGDADVSMERADDRGVTLEGDACTRPLDSGGGSMDGSVVYRDGDGDRVDGPEEVDGDSNCCCRCCCSGSVGYLCKIGEYCCSVEEMNRFSADTSTDDIVVVVVA